MQNLSTGLFTVAQCSSEKTDFTKFNHTLLQGSFYHCLPLYKCWCLHQFITDNSAALFSCVIAWLAFLCSFLHTLWCKLFPIPVSFREQCCNYRNLNILVIFPQFPFLLKNAVQLTDLFFPGYPSENFFCNLSLEQKSSFHQGKLGT